MWGGCKSISCVSPRIKINSWEKGCLYIWSAYWSNIGWNHLRANSDSNCFRGYNSSRSNMNKLSIRSWNWETSEIDALNLCQMYLVLFCILPSMRGWKSCLLVSWWSGTSRDLSVVGWGGSLRSWSIVGILMEIIQIKSSAEWSEGSRSTVVSRSKSD